MDSPWLTLILYAVTVTTSIYALNIHFATALFWPFTLPSIFGYKICWFESYKNKCKKLVDENRELKYEVEDIQQEIDDNNAKIDRMIKK